MAGRDNTELSYVKDALIRIINRSSHFGVQRHYGELTSTELWYEVLPDNLRRCLYEIADHTALRFTLDKYTRGFIAIDGYPLCLYFKEPIPTAPGSSHPLLVPASHPLFWQLRTFAEEATAHSERMTQAREFVDRYVSSANTLGQLARMWPDVVPYLNAKTSLSARNQVRRSRLPRDFEFSAEYAAQRLDVSNLLALGILVDSDKPQNPDVWVP